jgi:hypothetical protein
VRSGRVRSARATAFLLSAVLLAHASVSAQEAHPSSVAIDTVASVDETVDPNGNHVTGTLFDSVVSVGVSRHLEAVIRPYVQRLPSGEWNRQIWVATLRYERSGPVGLRIDGGLIPSPVGYANMLMRPHLNPVVAQPSSLFTPLPAAEPHGPRTTLMGALYPYGVNVTLAGRRWDARTAVMDTSPLRSRRIFAQTNPPRFANVVVGGGITPLFGLRVGGSLTRGGWLRAGEAPTVTSDQSATVVSLEAEYSAAYTKVAGEWTHDALETSHGETSASGWFVQGQQTLTPRWFAAARVERMSGAAFYTATGLFNRLTFNGTEEVVGYRLTPEITLRGGHRMRDAFGAAAPVHAVTLSVVWWRRWN